MSSEWNTMQQHAAAYYNLGWIPIPLCWPDHEGQCACPKHHTNPKDIGKAPLMGGGYQSYRPKTIEQAVAPWRTNPDANIGILLDPSGLILLDLDSPEAIREALQLGMPEITPIVRRSNDREHRYFRNPGVPPHRATKRGESKAIDVLGLGYVVLPPSRHAAGSEYEWKVAPEGLWTNEDVNEAEIAFPQSWMLQMLEEVGDKQKQKPGSAVELDQQLPSVDIDKETLSLDLKRRIRYGTGEGMSAEDRAKFGDDRSRLVMSVMDSLLWKKWTDDKIAAILTDPQYAISDRILAKPDPYKYVADELTRARRSFDEKKGGTATATATKPSLEVLQGGKGAQTEGSSARQPEPRTNSLFDSNTVIASDKHLNVISDEAWTILNRKNSPPRFFQRNWSMVEVRQKDGGRVAIAEFSEAAFRGELARNMEWYSVVPGTKKGESYDLAISPRMDVVKDMMARIDSNIPSITGVTYVPVFSKSGAIVTEEGYHPETKLFYAANGLQLPQVSEIPDAEEVATARMLFEQELFGDFPFADDASRAHCMAAVLLPFVRPLIDGPTPLHLIDAPASGTGKTLLAQIIGELITGAPIATTSGVKSDEEWTKAILSVLRTGAPIVLFDNVENGINFPSLNNVVTSTMFSARLLGKSEMGEFPNLATWLVTGNNVDVSGDVLRRICWIRLDAKMENPFERKSFKRDIIDYLKTDRDSLIWAALTIVQNWIAQGRPRGQGRMGSFESWVRIIGGILGAAGITGFLDNMQQLRVKGDPLTDEWRALIDIWWNSKFDTTMQVKDILKIAEDNDLLLSIWGEKYGERGQSVALGNALKKKEGAVIDGKIIERKVSSRNRVNLYSLKIIRLA